MTLKWLGQRPLSEKMYDLPSNGIVLEIGDSLCQAEKRCASFKMLLIFFRRGFYGACCRLFIQLMKQLCSSKAVFNVDATLIYHITPLSAILYISSPPQHLLCCQYCVAGAHTRVFPSLRVVSGLPRNLHILGL
jgi:hypothetical protein